MDDFHIQPEALLVYGEGSQSLAEKFGQLADLLEQARVNDECFGPVGDAVGLSSGYFESLQECQQLAVRAMTFLMQAHANLEESHALYTGVDTGMAQGFTQLMDLLGGEKA
ncbi:hypothetical protein [Streptoalloteichus hindustanus]|uniref:Excreted virulence factor EspC, type VII ESX diderm n=1 Tax=Streptoalloteichus hindustanus TaxID=2017 RepID=A0A1M5N862_STRHI|nr:hypothetical protein [Streptoalloteichus hindustanus]SHG85688.1 hypothetical protein SAMN05444320_11527 [Streptoalloteichus hindustanus]